MWFRNIFRPFEEALNLIFNEDVDIADAHKGETFQHTVMTTDTKVLYSVCSM